MEGYLTVRQAAQRLGRSKRHVRRLIDAGRMEAKQDQVTRAIYIPTRAVDSYESSLASKLAKAGAIVPAPAREPPTVPPPQVGQPATTDDKKPRKRSAWTLLDEEV
ncbi:MAG TPA: helix-turn-helix domain-containing protein [Candidatus Thermoplasmatota archaeon]|nr:helix-turn-helix domain-containing protein [Candidatus Thermoplasmatota archaeon]